jgi:hypothetical protein
MVVDELELVVLTTLRMEVLTHIITMIIIIMIIIMSIIMDQVIERFFCVIIKNILFGNKKF